MLADAGLDQDLREALYAVESDHRHNPFADDAAPVLRALRDAVDVVTLSFEHGRPKPDPVLFTRTPAALGAEAHETLMVGDRSCPDGPAVEQGITTPLLPPLQHPSQRRLHLVLALVGLSSAVARADPPR